MGRGQAFGVLLQALDAEDLGADRLLRRRGTAEDGRGFQSTLSAAAWSARRAAMAFRLIPRP
jgi:hypothetical protein